MTSQSSDEQQRSWRIGALLYERRQQRGYSRGELGRIAHVDPSHLRRIESGVALGSRATLCSLAVALDFEPGELDKLLYEAQYAPILDWQAAFMRLVETLPKALSDCISQALAETEAARYDRLHAERNARMGKR